MKRINFACWFLIAGVLILTSGCALQADLVDAQMDLEKMQLEQSHIRRLLEGADRPEGLLESTQKSQGDLVLRMDQLTNDVRAVQGMLEEDRYTLSQLMQKVDEQNFRSAELESRLRGLESQLAALPDTRISKPDSQQESKPSDSTDDKKVVLPGRPPLSSLTPIEVYNLAYNDYLRGNYDLATSGFQTFIKQYPESTLTPHAHYWLGESYYSKRDYLKAIDSFEQVAANYPESEKAVTALLKEGFSYMEMGNKAKARTYLKRVIEEYPRSNEANLAKNKLAEIDQIGTQFPAIP
jgi:tol-pal system protein YbgF